jgi:hypothetical protein
MALRTFIDRYALIIAMVLGALGYKWLTHLNGLTSPLIFLMLFSLSARSTHLICVSAHGIGWFLQHNLP